MNYLSNNIQYRIVRSFSIILILLVFALPVMASGWTQQQKITSVPRGVGAQFGNAVAISGNTMVVGARFDSTTAASAGAAFVFVLNGTTWTQQQKLLASDGAANDKFGYSVAISEDTIVVGAYQDDSPLSDGGSAYVFVRNGSTWTQQQKLIASDGKADLSVYRPSNGTWYLQQCSAGFTAVQFGITTDLPSTGDYDGDGKADIAVFRNGIWYELKSTQGFAAVQFGASGDKPIPSAYVP